MKAPKKKRSSASRFEPMTPPQPQPMTPPVPVPQQPQQQLLNRARSAEFLGISESNLRRKEESNELPPVFNEKGHHMHTLEQLRACKLRQEAKALPSSPEFDPNTASSAFSLFKQGFGPADAVRMVPCAPRVAQELYEQWVSMKALFLVSGEARKKIDAFGALFGVEINNGDDLAELLDQAVSVSNCTACSQDSALYCARCCMLSNDRVLGLAAAAVDSRRAYFDRVQERERETEFARRVANAGRPATSRAQQRAGTETAPASSTASEQTPSGNGTRRDAVGLRAATVETASPQRRASTPSSEMSNRRSRSRVETAPRVSPPDSHGEAPGGHPAAEKTEKAAMSRGTPPTSDELEGPPYALR
jgi:hypothetical protein